RMKKINMGSIEGDLERAKVVAFDDSGTLNPASGAVLRQLRNRRRRLLPHPYENESVLLLTVKGRNTVLPGNWLVRPLRRDFHDRSLAVVLPAVVSALDPSVLEPASGQRKATMAAPVQKRARLSVGVPEKNNRLVEDRDALELLFELRGCAPHIPLVL